MELSRGRRRRRVDRAIHEPAGRRSGHVVATDINTDWISCPLPANVELRCHDIGIDPLPDAAFDVVHARAVLTFVPERRTALNRMIAALKPNGWLLIEEMLPPITDAWDRPDEPDVALARKARRAIMEMVRRGGCDPMFPLELPVYLGAAGWPTSARIALLVTGHRHVVLLGEGPDELQPHRGHGGAGGLVDRHRLREDPREAEVLESVAHEFAGALGRISLTPVALRQSIAEISLAGYPWLAWPVRWLQHPQPDRFTVAATDPLAEPVRLHRRGQCAAQPLLGLLRGQAPVEEEAMHHWVGVQVDQEG